ncbi:MAG: endopeptidase La [Thermoanaerobaculia bacterium]|nr:MAG: endopeptidase La [Thermoanaerobaculia bacterium]MBZ0100626.1 endopeptidase La [Thermoanaerobaculia bacterium]
MTQLLERDSETLPVVPLRDMVVFPHMMAPFIVGRDSSIRALEAALAVPGRRIYLVAQRDPKVDDPVREDLFDTGVVARVVQNLKLPNGNIKVMVEGIQRARIREFEEHEGTFRATVEMLASPPVQDERARLYMARVQATFEQYAKLSQHLAIESLLPTLKHDDPDRFADALAAHLAVSTADKQTLLDLVSPFERLERLEDLLEVEIEKMNLEKRINVQVKKQMEKAQKEYYLNEKIKAIHQELGRKDDRSDEMTELREKIEKAGLPKQVREKAEAELKRLEAMPPVSAEATVSRNYIDWLIAVPWKKTSKELRDLVRAEEILNSDHHGLEKIKERILEFLAVRQLTTENPAQILCFVGPPGVGKSSLAQSIAKATGRKFVRLSLGGVRDEAEIRGHRRTYIGAFPGQIIQMMKKAGTVNPVFLLDEIDKMSMDFRGDPSAALLEVLDPAQNHAFVDHFLDVEFDLSRVMFIATANVIFTVPAALRDRMEVIQLSGYTMSEKLAIGRQFLVPRQLKAHGLDESKLCFTDEGLRVLIESYTREAGVRNLDREIAAVCRKVARRVVAGGDGEVVELDAARVVELLGKARFRPWKKDGVPEIGVTTGLAWTEVGGEILETEVGLMRGKGNLILTGKLGEVMQESARAAVSYLRSRADLLGIDADFSEKFDLHIHVPEGAIPKDGPSAGITMATALVSAVTRRPVRRDLAMTGEITLRGKVLPVGGIKDKVLAAFRAGITEVILPRENEKDLEEIPVEVRDRMTVHFVESMDEVLRLALEEVLASPPPGGGELRAAPPEPPPGSGSLAH